MKRARTYKLFRETKSKTLNIGASLVLLASSLGGSLPLLLSHNAAALGTVVSPSSTGGWGAQDGTPTFAAGPNGADGAGSLMLTTVTQPKQNYFHAANTSLSGISGLGYKVNVAAGVPASYQLQVLGVHRLDSSSTFDSLIWEPVYNGQVNGPNGGFVTESDLENGIWWSSHPIDGDPLGNNGFVHLSDIISANPGATIVAYGVNVGSGTPNATSYVDDFVFQSNVMNFEPDLPAVPSGLRFENPSIACGGYTNVNFTTAAWDAVPGAVSYDYHVDGPGGLVYDTNLSGTSNSGSFGSGTQGTYTFKVRSVDGGGLKSDYSAPCSITYDATAPTVPVNGQPRDGAFKNTNDFYFTWDASSDATPLTYEFQSSGNSNVDGNGSLVGAWNSIANGNSEQNHLTTPQIHSTGAPDGHYYWQVRAIDAAGNKSGWSQVWDMNIDSQAPTGLANQSPADDTYTTTAAQTSISWTAATDPHGPVTYYYESSNSAAVNVDGSFASPVYGPVSTGSTNHINTPGTPAGVYYWHVRAVDAGGKSTAWTTPWKITVDNTAPTATLSFDTPGPATTSFQVQFSEAVKAAEASDPANYFLHNWPGAGGSGSLAGNATVAYDATSHIATVTFTNPAWYVSAEQQWGVQVVHDLAGNLLAPNPTSSYSTTLVNPTAPGTPTTTNPNNSHNVVWTWAAATDPGGADASGVKGYFYTLTQGANTVVGPTFTTSLGATTAVPADGSYTLHVYAVDNAGNLGPEATGNVVVDTVSPTLTINPSNGTDTTPTVTGTTSDSTDAVVVTVNGHNYTATVTGDGTWSADVTDPLTVGSHPVSVTSTDTAGNGTTETASLNVTAVSTPAPAAPATLGASTTTPAAAPATFSVTPNNDQTAVLGDSTDTASGSTGKVKGDSTVNLQNAKDTHASNFLGLGWWWLAVLAALFALWLAVAFRRSNKES